MGNDDEHWRAMLRTNVGFEEPNRWIEYARKHCFKNVEARQLATCPDCDAPGATAISQYIYYSTLIQLRHCGSCGLFYSDAHLDPDVIQQHFELQYKDESYFTEQGSEIFERVTEIVADLASSGARVVDIGGAKGHLLATLRKRRPDLQLTLADLSEEACRSASENFSLHTVCGSISKLAGTGERYDVVLLIDVIYYEPDIQSLWAGIERLTDSGGIAIIRVPNTLPLIRFCSAFPGTSQKWRARVPFFNPEHIFAFSPEYLRRRLRRLGFHDVEVLPSPLRIRRGGARWIYRAVYGLAVALHRISRGRAVLCPSIFVVARKPPVDSAREV